MQGLIPEPYEGAPHLGGEAATRQERIRRWRAMARKLPREGEQVFLRIPSTGRLSVLVHDVCDALLMVSAPSQRKAYSLALPFRSYFSIYLGRDLTDGNSDFLLELRAKPKSNATTRYYEHHYRHERKSESAYLREKKYFEERTLYDLAFLSAFRALEALLGTAQIHKHAVGKLLAALDGKFGTSFCSTRWESYHEVFSSGRKRWRFDELISHYLDLRNAVAAHANPKPPFTLREDQVLEIQLLVKSMLHDVAKPMQT